MKEQILKLREEGKSYRQIQKILNCSKATISYHCGAGQKEKVRTRTRALRQNKLYYKISRYKSTSLRTRIYNFQRRVGLELNSSPDKFTVGDVIKKLGPHPSCYLTGVSIDLCKPDTYQFDHIVPVSKGGQNTLANLGLTTTTINRMKHTLTVDEFLTTCMSIIAYQGNKLAA